MSFMGISKRLFASLFWLTLLISSVCAQEPSEEVQERWWEEDEQVQSYPEYSGGEQLEFIAPVTDRPIPFSLTRLNVSPQSVRTGWVGITQCHEGLDPVPDAEVVYSFKRMRGLRITEKNGIAKAWVDGQSVQLKDVTGGAGICVEMEANILQRSEAGRLRLRYGPFMRKFLDSYFPMHVALEVSYPAGLLYLDSISPVPYSDISLSQQRGRLFLDTWFKGKLVIELVFHANN